jgi:threonine dehydrogenase-like Zn-dependent dehydrogenase
MKALCWHGRSDVRIDNVPDPTLQGPRDALLRVTSTAICGSDLHLFDGFMPAMEDGYVLGHEFMGEVVDVGEGVKNLARGDRVVVPFCMACGECFFCRRGLYSACDRSNPDAEKARKEMGQSPAGMFGYSHLLGGFAGGQAELVRVPFADVGPLKIQSDLDDEQVLFLSDILPTAFMAAENAEIEAGETVAVWGCGPVGQLAIECAWLFRPERIIAIDCVPERLEMARVHGEAEVIDFLETDVYERLMELTHGRGPDRCIDAVGAEAHGSGSAQAVIDKAKTALALGTDRPAALREAIRCCRKGGTVSVPGVYVGYVDKFPMGALVNKGLRLHTGQTHVHRYMRPLMQYVERGEIDPTFIITHRVPLQDAPEAYKLFRDKQQGCVKVVMRP